MAQRKPKLSWTQRVADFLTGSGVSPLALVGKAIGDFGAIPVISFLVGAAAVYGYALIWPLPGAATSNTNVTQQTAVLRGEINTLDNKPLPRFKLALRGPEFGPFDDGHFELTGVQRAESYSLIVWDDHGFNQVMMFGDRRVIPDGDSPTGLKFEQSLQNFPANMGRVKGTITDQSGRAVKGEVEVAGFPKKIDPEGTFEVVNIPLGIVEIVILDEQGKPLHREKIKLEPTTTTPLDLAIRVPQ
jgi:hypothetical protein